MNDKKENPFVSSLIVAYKTQSRKLSCYWARAAPILSCRSGPTLYSKGLYLGQPLSCPSLYRAMPARPDKTKPAQFATSTSLRQPHQPHYS